MRLQKGFSGQYEPFHFALFLVYYQKIQYEKGMSRMAATTYETKECDYCSGKGYFQLLLGGSETCTCCNGSGKKKG
jgi:Family of unknown function (DUF5351)